MAFLAFGGFVLAIAGAWMIYPPIACILAGGVICILSVKAFADECANDALRK
jgi:hypothetical protein